MQTVSGISSSCVIWGLLCADDNDQMVPGKLAPTSLLNYLEKKSHGFDTYQERAYQTAKAYKSDYALFKVLNSLEEGVISYAITEGVFSVGSRALSALQVVRAEDELFNFSKAALDHMNNPGRKVPVQILDDIIKNSKGLVDPEGSRALMYMKEFLEMVKLIT